AIRIFVEEIPPRVDLEHFKRSNLHADFLIGFPPHSLLECLAWFHGATYQVPTAIVTTMLQQHAAFLIANDHTRTGHDEWTAAYGLTEIRQVLPRAAHTEMLDRGCCGVGRQPRNALPHPMRRPIPSCSLLAGYEHGEWARARIS